METIKNQVCIAPCTLARSDYEGYWKATANDAVWVDGILTQSIKEGFWFVIEDIELATPSELVAYITIVNNGCLVLKEKNNEIVKAHPNFQLLTKVGTDYKNISREMLEQLLAKYRFANEV